MRNASHRGSKQQYRSCSQSLLLLLARATYIMVLFFKHIPFVVNHTINATPPERLQQCIGNDVISKFVTSQLSNSIKTVNIFDSFIDVHLCPPTLKKVPPPMSATLVISIWNLNLRIKNIFPSLFSHSVVGQFTPTW